MSDDQLPLFAAPGDGDARDAIRTRLSETLFVEAGAGTGKTSALVSRIVALVTSDDGGPVAMRNIAAITFTEKAAAELRERVRLELTTVASDVTATELVRGRCRAAIDELDTAAICTLHSFAQRILTEFPIEAGLPPRLQVRDEIASLVAFDARWRRFLDALLADVDLQDAILVVLASSVRLEHLRIVAEVLDDNWDLLDRVADVEQVPPLDLDRWLDDLDAVCAHASTCRATEDRLVGRLEEINAYGARIRGALDDVERITLLRAKKPSFNVNNCGRAPNWPDVNAVRDDVVRLGQARDAIVGRVLDIAIRKIAAALARGTAVAVGERRAAGELEFHDLLVLARTLLRDSHHGARARERLRGRYQRILIDEFQDTDPIQVELAALLGSPDPDDGHRPWTEMSVEPGRLFFVGDPKQSIYRFRRADIGTFLAAESTFAGHEAVYLTCNFRAAAPVLDWVNTVFGDLIQPYPGSQPEYRALAARRPAVGGPAVVMLGAEAHDDKPNAEALREREAADVVATVQAAVSERWQVGNRDGEKSRDACLGDICILLPARTSLGYLERALEDAGVPYRAETSSLVYSSRVVRDVLAAVRAIDDPSNELSMVTALRSALFGCGDDDLFTYHVVHRGSWDIRRDPPEDIAADHPVVAGMRVLGRLHEERTWLTPSEVLERLIRECNVLEHAALDGRFRDVARRVRFLVDQARAFGETAGGSLRDYLAWAELQGAEGARVVESVLPETDDDAVRIMTIHSAKGLEFPIVVCSGMTTAAQARRRGVQVLFPPAGGCEIRLARDVQTDQFELHQPIDEQMSFHEKLRLLYVACTRARDHLVVSVHRKARDLAADDDRSRWTHAELVWTAAQPAEWSELDDVAATPARPSLEPEALVSVDPDQWESEHAAAFARGVRRRSIAATTLAHRNDDPITPIDPGLAKEPRDLELPPWNKGRYGTAIGRAVHGVLQTVDLETGAGLEEAVAAQAAAEGVLGHESTIAALCRAALASESVRLACMFPRWRETYVAVPVEDLTLEGYVDLLYRDDEGLVVVDYKTDAVPDDAALADRVASYRVQTAAYAIAVESVTGERVARCVLCFLHPSGARETVIEGRELADAVDEVHKRLRAERDDPSPLSQPVLAEA